MDAAKLADLAGAVFGEDRVKAAARLDQAIELALALAGETAGARGPGGSGPGARGPGGSGPGGSGAGSNGAGSGASGSAAVLITGSVITAGEAGALLCPPGEADPGAGQQPPASRRAAARRASGGSPPDGTEEGNGA
jgi:hypothetical protein